MSIRRRFVTILLISASLSFALELGSKAEEQTTASKMQLSFALDLFSKAAAADAGNLLISPVSLGAALALTTAGASGTTAAELEAALHLPKNGGQPAQQELARFFTASTGGKGPREYDLSMANALWLQRGINLRPIFQKLASSSYGASVDDVDFFNPEAARRTINSWVESRTRRRISELIPQGALDASSRLVLTNAVYFKGSWERSFDRASTADGPFTSSRGARVQVPMMHRTGGFGYMEASGVKTLQLPYCGGDLSMVILLPEKFDGIAKLERSLTSENLTRWISKLETREVVVTLPKFRLTAEREMSSDLQALGVKLAFGRRADFSKITSDAALNISAILHKTFVEVNEQGTEAAAATATLMTLEAGPSDEPKPPIFRADHPFLLLIRHERTGAILFLGRFAEPTPAS